MRVVKSFAPGRVNLIGEHIDYSGFNVLPCCICNGTTVTVTANIPQNVALEQVDHSRPDVEQDTSANIRKTPDAPILSIFHEEDPIKFTNVEYFKRPIIASNHKHWTDYVTSVYLSLIDLLPVTANIPILRISVQGTIPIAAGLSSSSALVVATAIGLDTILDLELSKIDLASICIKAERLVGTAGGGMDQTCILFAEEGKALEVSFDPSLSVRPVRIPGPIIFIAAHSMIEATKAVDAPSRFNRRVVECQIASFLLGCSSLRRVLDHWSLQEALALVDTLPEKIFPETWCEGYPDRGAFFNGLNDLLKEAYLSSPELFIQRRARHTFTEAARVQLFIQSCSSSGAMGGWLEDMGRIMNESDSSCHDDYDCGCEELKELCGLFRRYGAYGSRLTGAGWGGFTISIVSPDTAQHIQDNIYREYYERRGVRATDISRFMFQFTPSGGARLMSDLVRI